MSITANPLVLDNTGLQSFGTCLTFSIDNVASSTYPTIHLYKDGNEISIIAGYNFPIYQDGMGNLQQDLGVGPYKFIFSINDTNELDSGTYWVIITNTGLDSYTSNQVSVTINPLILNVVYSSAISVELGNPLDFVYNYSNFDGLQPYLFSLASSPGAAIDNTIYNVDQVIQQVYSAGNDSIGLWQFQTGTLVTETSYSINNPVEVNTLPYFPFSYNIDVSLSSTSSSIIVSADQINISASLTIPTILTTSGGSSIIVSAINNQLFLNVMPPNIINATTIHALPNFVEIFTSMHTNAFTAMFVDFAGNLTSMGNGTNMPNGWITKCDSKYNNERRLFNKVISESIKLDGVCLDFYVTTWDKNYYKIWGEDNNRRFVRKFAINGYYTLPREDKLWTKFGAEGIDTFSIFVAKEHFLLASLYDYQKKCRMYNNLDSSTGKELGYIPRIGDILMAGYNKYIYEITEVKEEAGQYLLSNQYVWEFIVKPFKDEHLTLSPDTSASMTYIQNYIDKDTDIFDVKTVVDDKKIAINYAPKTGEKSSQDYFGGW